MRVNIFMNTLFAFYELLLLYVSYKCIKIHSPIIIPRCRMIYSGKLIQFGREPLTMKMWKKFVYNDS